MIANLKYLFLLLLIKIHFQTDYTPVSFGIKKKNYNKNVEME